MKWIPLCVLCCFLCGCVLSQKDRDDLIERIVEKAKKEAYDAAYDKAIDEGLSPEAAKEVATKVADKAGELAKEGADKTLPDPVDGASPPWWLAIVQMLLLGIPKGGKG